MDRRQLLNAMVSRGTESAARNQALPIAGGLNPYNGPWNYAAAAHLLRRAMFGPTHEQIKQAVAEGLSLPSVQDLIWREVAKNCVDFLVSDRPKLVRRRSFLTHRYLLRLIAIGARTGRSDIAESMVAPIVSTARRSGSASKCA